MPITVNSILAEVRGQVEKTASVGGQSKAAQRGYLAELSDQQLIEAANAIEARGERQDATDRLLEIRKSAREETQTPQARIRRESELHKLAYRQALQEMGLLNDEGHLDPLKVLFPNDPNPTIALAKVAAKAVGRFALEALTLPDNHPRR